MYRYYLALRYMVSRPINLLGMIGVMVGVWALIVVVSIFDGYSEELRNHFSMTSSDLMVYHLGKRVRFDRIRPMLEADPNVALCTPRVVWEGLIHPRSVEELQRWIPGAVSKSGRFVRLLGVDPGLESRTTGFQEWLDSTENGSQRVDREDLEANDDWILVSSSKAATLRLKRGEDLIVTTGQIRVNPDTGDPELPKATLRIAGTFATRHAGFDNLTAFVSIDRMRKLVAEDNDGFVNEIAIALKSTTGEAIDETRIRLRRAMAADPDLRHQRPQIAAAGEQESRFLEAINHQAGLMKVVLFVIMVVAGFLIYATLSMMVAEKIHDIGVISALGGTRAGVLQVFLSCGLAIASTGTLLGVVSGCITSVYLDDFNNWMKSAFDVDLFPTDIYNLPRVPYYLDPLWITIVAGSSLLLGLLVSALPAVRAMQNDPLECLRNA